MRVEAVMTSDVITVDARTPLKEAAKMLAGRGISGLPVVENEQLVGVLSEADILEKEAAERTSGKLERLLGRNHEGTKRSARTAGEAMTSPAVTVSPWYGVSHAARLMADRGINRLPVVDNDGALVGIVTRADLVRAFVRSDDEITRELREDVVVGTLWMDAHGLSIAVERGEVTLSGQVDQRADAELLERLAARVPGVVSVRSELGWRVSKPTPQSEPYSMLPSRNR